jgi:hypothetical protein
VAVPAMNPTLSPIGDQQKTATAVAGDESARTIFLRTQAHIRSVAKTMMDAKERGTIGEVSQNMFKTFTAEGSATIGKFDFLGGCLKIGLRLSMKELDLAWALFDTNNDGGIDYDEFASIISPGYYTDVITSVDLSKASRRTAWFGKPLPPISLASKKQNVKIHCSNNDDAVATTVSLNQQKYSTSTATTGGMIRWAEMFQAKTSVHSGRLRTTSDGQTPNKLSLYKTIPPRRSSTSIGRKKKRLKDPKKGIFFK